MTCFKGIFRNGEDYCKVINVMYKCEFAYLFSYKSLVNNLSKAQRNTVNEINYSKTFAIKLSLQLRLVQP